ncbi:hypothetical protein Tco_0017123 [Tanacetum coccineum]
MASFPNIDSLFDEFAGELITIPPRIVNREHEEYISLLERLLYDNSSPWPPKDFHANPKYDHRVSSHISYPGDDNSTSLPEFESFNADYPDSGDSTIDVVEDIPIDVPNILPTQPTLHMDFDFISFYTDLGFRILMFLPLLEIGYRFTTTGICIEDCPDLIASRAPGFVLRLLRASKSQLHSG